jgi:hypothetical protein
LGRALTEKHAKILTSLWDSLPTDTVIVPTGLKEQHHRVCKIHFVGQGSSGGHPAPDPMLLVVKAAIVWSAFHNQRLLPAGEAQESDDDASDLSNLAEEMFLEWRDANHKQAALPFDSISIQL